MCSDSKNHFCVTVKSLTITHESAGKESDIGCTSLHCCPCYIVFVFLKQELNANRYQHFYTDDQTRQNGSSVYHCDLYFT